MSKMTTARISNFKRLRLVELKPEGELVVIGGKNGNGKSSVLDAIVVALGGLKYAPENPVRNGADKAEIVITTDDGYTIRRYFTAEGTEGLKITDAKGFSPAKSQTFLDGLFRPTGSDPLEFMRKKPAEQQILLKEIVGIDFSELDARRAEVYEYRRQTNARLNELKAENANRELFEDAPDDEIDTAALVTQLTEAAAVNKAVSDAVTKVEYADTALADAERQLAAAKELVTQCRAQRDALRRERELMSSIDTSDIESQLANAASTNEKVRINREIRAGVDKWNDLETKRVAFENELGEIDAAKEKLLSEAKFPIPGLSFGEDGPLLNGQPLSQASGAEQLLTSVALWIKTQPAEGLRLVPIHDGSLLDEDSMALLEELAIKENALVLIERVGSEGATLIIEDGAVKGVQPKLEEVPA